MENGCFENFVHMRGAKYDSTDFCKGEGAKKGEGRKFSPSSTQFTEKCCKHSKKSSHAKGKGVYSPLSQQGFYVRACPQ